MDEERWAEGAFPPQIPVLYVMTLNFDMNSWALGKKKVPFI